MAEHKKEHKKEAAHSKPAPSMIGFFLVIIIIAGMVSKTSWGKKLLQDEQTATTTGTVATSTY
ncbi:MAG TPA: hypothetical protein VJG48_02115 [Candidatus Paceibacterota bacterium]